MRAAFVLLAVLAMPVLPAYADEVADGECWAAFSVLGQAAARSPAAKAAMDNGAAAAKGEIAKLLPKASEDELGVVLKVYGSDLVSAMKARTVTQQQLIERANACEAQYGLPVSDFTKFRAAKPE